MLVNGLNLPAGVPAGDEKVIGYGCHFSNLK
jgi:hypothetical protein